MLCSVLLYVSRSVRDSISWLFRFGAVISSSIYVVEGKTFPCTNNVADFEESITSNRSLFSVVEIDSALKTHSDSDFPGNLNCPEIDYPGFFYVESRLLSLARGQIVESSFWLSYTAPFIWIWLFGVPMIRDWPVVSWKAKSTDRDDSHSPVGKSIWIKKKHDAPVPKVESFVWQGQDSFKSAKVSEFEKQDSFESQ